ncbi:MAG TPA: hypothetical protein PK733_15245 [Clostridiales bacterium]|nr:hypothetical protein [Clostridiales bacterium]
MKMKVVPIQEIDIRKYGRFYYLDCAAKRGDGWESTISSEEIMNSPCHIGLVRSQSIPISISSLERHITTKEVMITTTTEVVVALATTDVDDSTVAPHINQVECISLPAGSILIINERIWHSACYGLTENALYYFIYSKTDEPVIWTKIKGGVCEITV